MIARLYVLALSSVFATHFFLVFFSAMPVNPISIQFRHEIAWYVDALFIQNWALFGPNPPDSDESVLAQYELRDGARTVVTPWYDVSKSLRAHVSRNPFTPLAIFTQILNRTAESLSNSHAIHKPGEDFDLDAPSAGEVAARVAVAYEPALHLRGELHAVRVSLVLHHYPRFSEYASADDPAHDTVHFDYPWRRDVAVARFAQLAP